MLKDFIKSFTESTPLKPPAHVPTIIPRSEHTVSRSQINPNALKVLYRLNSAGFSAYLVGGCIRDILLGFHPKDFDIATSASPEEVRKLFRNCRLIGKRFRLAHIIFGKDIIEVATFRTQHKEEPQDDTKLHRMILRDNVYGSIEDDAWRRDFTINALYYNIADFSLVDYTDGLADLKSNLLRMIGDPEQRFHEDPVRILRAVRFAAKLKLTISPETELFIYSLHTLLLHVSPSRLFTEVLKFFQSGATLETFKLLQKYDLFKLLFPLTAEALDTPETTTLIEHALQNTDNRFHEGKSVSPAFLFSVFVWKPIQRQMLQLADEDIPPAIAFEKAIRLVLRRQVETLSIPKRLLLSIRDICFLQHRFTYRAGNTPFRLLDHPRFRAAFDLLLFRTHSGENTSELSEWWQTFYDGDVATREQMVKEANAKRSALPGRPRRRRRGKKKDVTG